MNCDKRFTNQQAGHLLYILAIVTFFLWLVSYSGVQFKTSKILLNSADFPGDKSTWQFIGPVENTQIGETTVVLSRQKSGYSGVEKSMRLSKQPNIRNSIRVKMDYYRKIFHASAQPLQSLESAAANTGQNEPAYISLRSFDHNNALTKVHIIERVKVGVTGNGNNIQISRVVKLPANTNTVHLGLLLRESNSSIVIVGASVEEIEVQNAYIVVIFTIALLTALATCIVIYRSKFALNKQYLVLGGSLLALLIWSVIVSGDTQSLMLQTLSFSDTTKAGALSSENKFRIGAMAHLFLFFLLGSYIYLVLHRLKLDMKYFFGYTFLFALATEALQLHFPGRSSSMIDVLFDIIGALLGLMVCELVFRYRGD